jgi:hypothetical protein
MSDSHLSDRPQSLSIVAVRNPADDRLPSTFLAKFSPHPHQCVPLALAPVRHSSAVEGSLANKGLLSNE